MIDYGLFWFAAPPRTGSTWTMHALSAVGLGDGAKSKVHELFPPREGYAKARLTLVRHPCDWLASYYASIRGGCTSVRGIDQEFAGCKYEDFVTFVHSFLKKKPGVFSRIAKLYEADVCLRIEDMPAALVEFLQSVGVKRWDREKCYGIGPRNITKDKPIWTPHLYQAVASHEKELIDDYGYQT